MSGREIKVEGFCDPKYSSVKDEFYENFATRNEIGSAVCVYEGGNKVVDLWGGYRDEDGTQPWTEDTITLMSSIAKSMSALCVHVLVDRGMVSLDSPVSE